MTVPRGSLRVATDETGEITAAEATRRLATFEYGPCPGYQTTIQVEGTSQHGNVIPMRREKRRSENRARRARFVRGNMLDVIFVAATVIFFLLALAYVEGCERL